jgi:hypothetical protein
MLPDGCKKAAQNSSAHPDDLARSSGEISAGGLDALHVHHGVRLAGPAPDDWAGRRDLRKQSGYYKCEPMGDC